MTLDMRIRFSWVHVFLLAFLYGNVIIPDAGHLGTLLGEWEFPSMSS